MPRFVRLAVPLLAAGVTAASLYPAHGGTVDHTARATTTLTDALTHAASPTAAFAPLRHRVVPEDTYAMAGGCYTVRSAVNRHYVTRGESGFAATAAGDKAAA